LKLMSANKEHEKYISSLEINTDIYQWKCVQFWYLIRKDKSLKLHSPSLHVSTVSSGNQQQHLIKLNTSNDAWHFVQLPIQDERKLKVIQLCSYIFSARILSITFNAMHIHCFITLRDLLRSTFLCYNTELLCDML
jgi:hypothetical protein